MFLSQFRRLAWRLMGRSVRRRRPQLPVRQRLQLHALLLEERAVPAVVANPDPAAGHESAYSTGTDLTMIVGPADGVLINDTGATSLAVFDADGNPENGIQVTQGPTHGTLTMHADGSFVYTPNSGFQGLDSFRYQATDGTDVSAPATVTLVVGSLPAAQSQSLQTNEDTAVSGTLMAVSPSGGTLSFALVDGSAVGGIAQVNSDGSFRFTPNPNLNGNAGFQFTASDATGTSAPASVAINVNAVDDPPVIMAPASAQTPSNTDLVFHDISVSDVDAGSGQLNVTIASSQGTFSVNSASNLPVDGNDTSHVSFSGTLADINAALNGLTFNPTGNFSGSADILIRVDDQGNTGAVDPTVGTTAFKAIAVNVQGLATVTGTQIGATNTAFPDQRSVISQVTVNFSEPVSVHPDSAFTLIRNGSEPVPVHVTWDAAFKTATLTFNTTEANGASLANGSYQLQVNGDQLIGPDGQAVDANGDNMAGGVLNVNFYRLFGDINGDRVVDATDLAALRSVFGATITDPNSAAAAFDANGDGVIDQSDLDAFRANFGASV
jgi:VCBS repeat-containing protein